MYFPIAFAAIGDTTTVPLTGTEAGTINFQYGYGSNYSASLTTDPDALLVDRQTFNYMMNAVTSTLQGLYQTGLPPFITAAENQSVAYSYAPAAMCLGADGKDYFSLATGNTATPGTDPSKWLLFNPAQLSPRGMMPLASVTGGTYSFASLGAGCTLTFTVSGGVINAISSVAAGGSAYVVGDLLTPNGGNYDAVIRVTGVSGGVVTSAAILYGGTGFTAGTAVATQRANCNRKKITLAGVLANDALFLLPNGAYLTNATEWIVGNNTTGSHTTTFKISNGSNAGTGTGVVVLQGTANSSAVIIDTDGVSDVYVSAVPNLTSTDLSVVITHPTDGVVDLSVPNISPVNVKSFGAVGDNTTDDTAAVQAAITSCASTGQQLFWPAGTYLLTDTIANFHTIRHRGNGAVRRGSDTFYVEPRSSQTNHLYIGTGGNDTNDGLTAAKALLTLQKPFDLMFNYGPVLNGGWQVILAAGTLTEGAFINGLRSKQRIVVKGPDVSSGTPTAIVDGTTALLANGLYFQNYMYVQVQDIKFQNFTNTADSYGVLAEAMSDMYCSNVHTDGNQYGGINVNSNTILRVKGGTHNANLYHGIRAYSNCVVTIGYQGSAMADRPQITNNSVVGVALYNMSQGHVDYCDFSTNVTNILMQNESRLHILGTTAAGASNTDVMCSMFSTWFNDLSTVNTFSSTVPFQHMWSADFADQYFEVYDKTNNRIKWGGSAYGTPQNKYHYVGPDGASGATFTSSAAHSVMLIENNSSCYVQLATPGGSVEAGFLFSKPSNAAYAQIIYSFSSDTFEMKIAGTEIYDFDATQFYPNADNAKNLGQVAKRWAHAYITDIVASTVAATTFTGALVGNASTATSATTAANLSGTPALPNGTTATTQTARDNSTKLATTAYADNAASTIGGMQTKSADYTLIITDTGVLHPSADTTARTMTIPANGSVAYPLFTVLTFINQDSAGVMSIAITTDTMRLSPGGATGTRTLAANGIAVATKVTTTEWIISGSGLT